MVECWLLQVWPRLVFYSRLRTGALLMLSTLNLECLTSHSRLLLGACIRRRWRLRVSATSTLKSTPLFRINFLLSRSDTLSTITTGERCDRDGIVAVFSMSTISVFTPLKPCLQQRQQQQQTSPLSLSSSSSSLCRLSEVTSLTC